MDAFAEKEGIDMEYSPTINGVLTFGFYDKIFPECAGCGKKHPEVKIVVKYGSDYYCSECSKEASKKYGHAGNIACSCGANGSHICPITRTFG